MNYNKELDKLTEMADKIMKNSDLTAKKNGLINLSSKIKEIISTAKNVDFDKDMRFNYYIIKGFGANNYNKIIELFQYDFPLIKDFECDTPEQLEQRQRKLIEYEDCICVKSLDSIYCKDSSYRRYNEYKNQPFFKICMDIRENYGEYDFRDVCRLIILNMALLNELREIECEMELLEIHDNNNKSDLDEDDKTNYEIKINDAAKRKILELYNFWVNVENEKKGYINLFDGYGDNQYLTMVRTANFQELANKPKCKNRLKYTIYIISDMLNDKTWGAVAAKSIGTNYNNCSQQSNFNERESDLFIKTFPLYRDKIKYPIRECN